MKRQLSATTQSRIDELYEDRGIRGVFVGDHDKWLGVLEHVHAAAEPLAALELFPLILARDPTLAKRVANVTADLVRLVPVGDLPWLDEAARHWWPHHRAVYGRWRDLRPVDLDRLERYERPAVPLLGIASFHGDGFVREAAIEHLARFETGEELSFLLIRLNDWVENVRLAARTAVEARLDTGFVPAFVSALPLVLRLARTTRSENRDFVARVGRLLSEPANRIAVLSSLATATAPVRRYCFTLLASASPGNLDALLDLALSDHDPVVRDWALGLVSSINDFQTQSRLLSTALSDAVGRIRRRSLHQLATTFPDQARTILVDALMDRAATVRAEARARLKALSGLNPAEYYRERINHNTLPGLRIAVEGLGEVGTQDDVPILLSYLRHDQAAVRRAAVFAVGRLAGHRNLEALTKALVDLVPSVSRQAHDELAKHAHLLDASRLWAEMHLDRPSFVRQNILSLLARAAKWDSICYLIQATADPDPGVADAAVKAIDRWNSRFNHSFVAPSTDQITRLKSVLHRHRFALDRSTLRELEFSVNSFIG